MTNDDLNIRVAEARGWEFKKKYLDVNGNTVLAGKDPNGKPGHISNYRNSMDACMELLDEMVEQPHLHVEILYRRTGSIVCLHDGQKQKRIARGFGEKLPEAICKAYLAFKEGGK